MTIPPQVLHAWVDATAGIAGDMLLAALIDAGADLDDLQQAVETVIPGAVRLELHEVTRAGQRATQGRRPRRSARTPRTGGGTRSESYCIDAPLTESRPAACPVGLPGIGRSGGRGPRSPRRHHCISMRSAPWTRSPTSSGSARRWIKLGVSTLSASTIALGAGRVSTAHGDLPVPVPAVLRLAQGWRVQAGGTGELTTPTGMALIAALGARQ